MLTCQLPLLISSTFRIASIQEDTPGPSSLVGNQVPDQEEQEDVGQPEPRADKRKKDREDEFVELIRGHEKAKRNGGRKTRENGQAVRCPGKSC